MAWLAPPVWLENSAAHNAVDYRTMLGSLVGPAVAGVSGATALKVSQKSGTANMSVDVASGGVFIPSTRSVNQGTYHGYNDGVVNVAIAAADATNPRIDRILVHVRDQAQDAALTQNDVTISVVQGTPAASPAVPSTTIADFVELARVTVPAGATSITDANIASLRVAAPSWSRPRGVVAVIRSTAAESLSTSAGPEIAPSLTLSNVAIGADRRTRISLSGAFGITGTGPIFLTAEVYRSGVATGAAIRMDVATNGTQAKSGFTVDTLPAGTYDFTVRLSQSGAVTKRVRGDTHPITVLIEDLGGVLA